MSDKTLQVWIDEIEPKYVRDYIYNIKAKLQKAEKYEDELLDILNKIINYKCVGSICTHDGLNCTYHLGLKKAREVLKKI